MSQENEKMNLVGAFFRSSRVALIIGCACAVLGVGCEEDNSDSGSSSGGGDVVITQAEFNEIQNGMTYEQVAAIVGDPGQIVQDGGGTLIVVWQNYSPASYAQVAFVDGRAELKDSSGNLP
jgi:hypothetical protein